MAAKTASSVGAPCRPFRLSGIAAIAAAMPGTRANIPMQVFSPIDPRSAAMIPKMCSRHAVGDAIVILARRRPRVTT
jgi:hypothetical protein